MAEIELKTAPADFRFPTANQTRHCFTRYVEFHKCLAAQGEESTECEKFARYYRSLCPLEWRQNKELMNNGKLGQVVGNTWSEQEEEEGKEENEAVRHRPLERPPEAPPSTAVTAGPAVSDRPDHPRPRLRLPAYGSASVAEPPPSLGSPSPLAIASAGAPAALAGSARAGRHRPQPLRPQPPPGPSCSLPARLLSAQRGEGG
ncbi:hypothetical protein Taro_029301 [Colocasia esculenta]|uniref:Uncharacterized protein n=1 Tax=Colocasia esculenta TaxID=4460 RepID=A0A843VSW2_COLES|nr:hypothetical protein [Colocasia esculenta]